MASAPIILAQVVMKVLKGKERGLRRHIPLIVIGAFIFYFFIKIFINLMFFYSLVAFSFTVSLIYLSPRRYFHNSDALEEKEMGGWIFIFSFEIFVLIMMINMALPFYSVLIIGVIFANYLLVSLLKSH
jgi:heme O synthase-like polyprenyltransferase